MLGDGIAAFGGTLPDSGPSSGLQVAMSSVFFGAVPARLSLL